jgi:TPR repeat protein
MLDATRMRLLAAAAMAGLLLALPVVADYNAGLAAFERGDFVTAQNEFLPLANQGNADAQYAIALIALRQTPPNYSLAVPWLEKGARGESADAQYLLGRLHQEGVGVGKNIDLANHWLQKAAQQGHEKATRMVVTQNLARQSTSRPELELEPEVSLTWDEEPEPNAPTAKALQPGANYEIEACTSRGIAYFKAIGSYPTLESTGRSADDVARERCNRTTGAY